MSSFSSHFKSRLPWIGAAALYGLVAAGLVYGLAVSLLAGVIAAVLKRRLNAAGLGFHTRRVLRIVLIGGAMNLLALALLALHATSLGVVTILVSSLLMFAGLLAGTNRLAREWPSEPGEAL
ncbi:hypothetical protein [Achromobacter anxifer]|nr:hypothetical protein [Achromobacter anxifer]MDF8364666.1 hypothetical protein [Achromobacter anxifer]